MTDTKTKKKRGRPPNPETAKEKVQTWFRATPAQNQRWKREAKKAGVPLRTWIKIACMRASEKPIDFKARAHEAADCIASGRTLSFDEIAAYLETFMREAFSDG